MGLSFSHYLLPLSFYQSLTRNEPNFAPTGKDREGFPRPDFLPMGVNWALVGASGVGKSALQNGLRGLKKNDPGAATEGITECTMEPQDFPFPGVPNVRLWDLPGYGTDKHRMQDYIRDKGLRYFNGVILVIRDGRPTEFDIQLMECLENVSVPFYIVQNRFQQTLESEDVDVEDSVAWRGVSEVIASTLRREYLARFDSRNQRVYFVNSRRLDRYDGPRLWEDAINDLKLQAPEAVVDPGCDPTCSQTPKTLVIPATALVRRNKLTQNSLNAQQTSDGSAGKARPHPRSGRYSLRTSGRRVGCCWPYSKFIK